MDLLIRSQDKTQLLKVIGLYYDYQQEKHHITAITENDYYWLGIYKSKERALEVLDEIQNKTDPKYFYKTSCLMKPEDIKKMETNLQQKYNADFIVGFTTDEIEPLCNDVLVYEMPEE